MKNVDRDRLDMDGFEEKLIKLNRVAKVVKADAASLLPR
jgi:ribosomal protein S5